MASIIETSPGRWRVQIRRKGFPFQSRTFKSKNNAKAWARQTEAAMDRGLFIDQSEARTTTFGDLIQLYIKNVTALRPSASGRIAEEARLRRFLQEEPKLCAFAVLNLRPSHFEAYRDRRLRQVSSRRKGPDGGPVRISPSTVKRELNMFKRILDYRRREMGLAYNPAGADVVRRPTFNDERDVRLTWEERDRLYAACDASRTWWLRPFVEMGFETGARRGSLLRLEWRDVDLERRTALLRAVKNSRNPGVIINHPIGLTPRAVEVLKSLPRGDKRVFPITANAFRLSFNRARAKAEVTHFRFHDTRHERTSSLFEAGWSMIQVMAQTGHRDPKSVKRYANISADHLADALAKLDNGRR